MKIKGFTLSEVLITIVIIGIIAAVTIPAIIQKTQKQEYVLRLKKAFAFLNQTLDTISRMNGYPNGDYSFLTNVKKTRDEFAKYSNNVKKCETDIDCFKLRKDYTALNNDKIPYGARQAFITSDGIMYSFAATETSYGLNEYDSKNVLYSIIIDINGEKKPNKYGLDLFFFYIIDNKGILPAGSSNFSDCNRKSYGQVCTAKVLSEGAINY